MPEDARQMASAETESLSPIFAMNENVLDKLKCLNYERDFVQAQNRRPFTREQFAIQADNNAIQFKDFELKAAYGEAVCAVLDFLTDRCLESERFVFKMPKHNEPAEPDDVDGDDDAMIDDDEIEDEVEAIEEDAAMFTEADENAFVHSENQKIIESRVDPIELRLNNNNVGKEWRSHINQTMKHSELIQKALPTTESILKQINNQLGGAVEKMKSKEKYLNTSFSQLCNEYQVVKASLSEIEDKHSTGTESVSVLTNELATIQDQLSDIKGTMDSRGSSMTDTSPLVKIKAALQEIKVEIQNFELRIGVVGQTLLTTQTANGGGDIDVEGGDDLDDEFADA
ncbi:hypothetical protein TrRE_jg8374 [Triparma retinervis]|uniref:Uncharacterized protein n=1 Tax=Triparma retinervis TaxID=2557542 RepID=A0A9W7DXH6_9STRA|nr:hypothetical protein TrRE_jg8374 [Triparma retinervis]